MNMSVNKSVTFVILLISSLLKGQVLRDTVAYEYLKTIQIAPVGTPLDFPAYELGVKNGLEFSFDDMAYEWNNYAYKIFHCTKDWEKSDLLINQYLDGFDGNYLNDFAISVGTFVPYTHYALRVPNVRMLVRVLVAIISWRSIKMTTQPTSLYDAGSLCTKIWFCLPFKFCAQPT